MMCVLLAVLLVYLHHTVCRCTAVQVSYAVYELKLAYDDDLFTELAKDFFHLRNTEGQGVRWQQSLQEGVDVQAAQQSLACTLGR